MFPYVLFNRILTVCGPSTDNETKMYVEQNADCRNPDYPNHRNQEMSPLNKYHSLIFQIVSGNVNLS
jgi:hypothetical protein